MPNDPLIEEYVEKYIQEFEKEPVCKHGFTRGHYICEPHDYPHVLGNRFGKDCETCNPPPKPTLQNKKSFLRTSLKEYGDKRVEGVKSESTGLNTLLEARKVLTDKIANHNHQYILSRSVLSTVNGEIEKIDKLVQFLITQKQ